MSISDLRKLPPAQLTDHLAALDRDQFVGLARAVFASYRSSSPEDAHLLAQLLLKAAERLEEVASG